MRAWLDRVESVPRDLERIFCNISSRDEVHTETASNVRANFYLFIPYFVSADGTCAGLVSSGGGISPRGAMGSHPDYRKVMTDAEARDYVELFCTPWSVTIKNLNAAICPELKTIRDMSVNAIYARGKVSIEFKV
ncbi:hypothetical protein COV18_01060 [Candidatus Woesearchaeota archaeon CG10_big_fil_rev_8_21_14_0_10_37_12]|nr:MAG: hypothetical protein COV18_01060 [Candidatus Woesearchaeota archaeon CG10_big_fil_rev_8_21_14_0_10_37_12]